MDDLFGNFDRDLAYQAGIIEPLDVKIERAIELIRHYEEAALCLDPEGFVVAFSGGKDSIVMERLFSMAGVKYHAVYNNVTIDPPELVRFIKDHYPEVRWNNPAKNLCSAMVDKSCGPPTRRARWCCEKYKEQGGNYGLKAIGVRAEESSRRKGLWTPLTLHRVTKKPILCPVLYWSEVDIWAFIRGNNMPYCSLYDEGFSRLGCVGCPMAGPKGQARDFARWPKYEAMWKRGFAAYWDKFKGDPRNDGGDRWIEKFNSVEDLWAWWISGEAMKDETGEADCQLWLW